jgi:sigma-E factor negative regulatory protein RseA
MNSGPVPLTTEPALPQGDSDVEHLSAWLDGELDERTSTALVAGLLSRPDLQHRYAGWCMVGDALRSREVVAEHSPALCIRISAALQAEPALLAPSALRTGLQPQIVRRHLASGFAVAAAAAVLVLVAVPQLRSAGTGVDSPSMASGSTASTAAAAGGTETAALALASHPGRNPRLDPYIQAHRDFMGSGVMPAAAVYLRSGNEGER